LSANLPLPKCRIEIYHGANTVIPIDENLTHKDILDLQVTLPILSRGIGGATFKLQNFNAAYTGLIAEHDKLAIWLYRTGDASKKVFGGRISKLGYEGTPGAPEYYMNVECMDFGDQLQVPPSLVSKTYVAAGGKTILTGAVGLCPDLVTTDVDPGNLIASTHTVNYDEVEPWTVVKEMIDAVKKADGSTGFDGYIDPTGDVFVFPRGSNSSGVDVSNIILPYTRETDTYRIKNKIKVYGAGGKDGRMEPTDGDLWTVDNISNWVAQSGGTSVMTDTPKVGTNYLRGTTGTSGSHSRFYRNFGEVLAGEGQGAYKTLNFWVTHNVDIQYPTLMLLAPDVANHFEVYLKGSDSWAFRTYGLGNDAMMFPGADPYTYWYAVGNADWRNLQAILFDLKWSTNNHYVNVDGLFFGSGRFRYETADSEAQNSINTYGVRRVAPIVDNDLQSDAECQKRAQALLALYLNPVRTWNLKVMGNNGFRPGDMQSVAIANDSINESFRIQEIVHHLQDVYWETTLI
jgi:hypothetical protein